MSVRATAFCPLALTASTKAFGVNVPQRKEYALWTSRWQKLSISSNTSGDEVVLTLR
jgi:hypothetical protein